MSSNEGKYKDRNPDIIAAGKCFTLGDTAKDCLNIPQKSKVPETVHKFRCTTNPESATRRIFYGRYNDPDIASLLLHGVDTKPSLMAGDLVNPRPKSMFVQKLHDKKESIYASRQRAPLGECHDQTPGLPKDVGPYDVTYGVPVIKDCTAGELVNPAKSRTEVQSEAVEGQEIYKVSHGAYDVGETYDRKYDWSKIPKTSKFGKETPHDNRGTNVRKTLNWLHETQSAKAAPVVSKRVDNFRERTQAQVGTVHDPIKETMKVSEDHTYGILVRPDEYGAGDLIHNRVPTAFLRGKDRERGVLAAIRQHLKKANYHNFHDLNAAFKYYDKDGSGKIDISELRDCIVELNLPIQRELLESLLLYCDINNDGQIDYLEFSNFLNWKDKMPSGIRSTLEQKRRDSFASEQTEDNEERTTPIGDENDNVVNAEDTKQLSVASRESTPQKLQKQIDKAVIDYKTSSQMINSTVGKVTTGDWRNYGIPTIRSDLPAPRIRRIGDNTNYGDESDAYGLMNPSLYSNYGVHENEFFQQRDENEMKRIFDSVGVAMDHETFQKLWQTARERHPNGEVSVASFRHILNEMAALELQKHQEEMQEEQNSERVLSSMIYDIPDIYSKINKLYGTQDKAESKPREEISSEERI